MLYPHINYQRPLSKWQNKLWFGQTYMKRRRRIHTETMCPPSGMGRHNYRYHLVNSVQNYLSVFVNKGVISVCLAPVRYEYNYCPGCVTVSISHKTSPFFTLNFEFPQPLYTQLQCTIYCIYTTLRISVFVCNDSYLYKV